MTEPTTEATDRAPWPEPRGPHLPDSLGILPGAVWLFVGLAVARLAWGLREAWVGPVIDPWLVGQVVLFGIPSIVSILLPGALLARHRDAASRLRTLLVGMILLAGVEGLRILGSPLSPIFEGLTPADPSVGFLVPSEIVYQATINLVNAIAITAIAQGLLSARRFVDRASSWPVSAVLAGLVVVVAVTGIVSVSGLPGEQLPLTGTVVAYVVSTVVLNVLSAATFGYLAATTTAGARAGEDPPNGWRLAALGGWLAIGSLAALGVVGVVRPTPETATLTSGVVIAIEAVFSLGFLGLLGGFVLGLPAPASSDDDPGVEDPDDEDADGADPDDPDGDVTGAEPAATTAFDG